MATKNTKNPTYNRTGSDGLSLKIDGYPPLYYYPFHTLYCLICLLHETQPSDNSANDDDDDDDDDSTIYKAP